MDRATYVFKIKYGDVLRRITVGASYCIIKGRGPDMTFSKLENTIRQAFEIPVASKLVIVYTDKDNDVVTMVDDDDVRDACVFQALNPVRVTVLSQESQRSAHDARALESLTVDPPPWAADIILKLDKLLLAVNYPLFESGVASVSTISTKTEDHVLGVDDAPVDGSTIERAKNIFPSEESRFDIAQSGYDSEFLRRAVILRQRIIADEFSD